uniref:Vegetative cell wall protein gp1-like n=1 Tax=Nicotiana sylvestris TaxID=4096 RepID=A0A1U7X8T9_NICSY|nr:PREDICTED: vegetative cell wall protein gp1-like [Nicotiana sylvestris]
MASVSEAFNSQSVGSNALNPIQMVSLPDYIEFIQYKARKQISLGLASVVPINSGMTCVCQSSPSESWVIDSDASGHISGNKSLFTCISNSQSLPTVTMASESQAMATAIGQASPLPSLLLDFVLYVPVPISHSSSSIAPPPTVPVAVPLTIGPAPPPSPVPPTIAPVPPPSPVQPSTTPPLLTYHHRPPPSSGPTNSRPTPDPANTTDLSPLNQPIALRKVKVGPDGEVDRLKARLVAK